MRRTSVRTGRNFSPARKVRSITAPSLARRSLVRTNAPPLPGFTCWNSMILNTVPSTSMCDPLRNWLVEIMRWASVERWLPLLDDAQVLRDAGEDLGAALGHDDEVLDPHTQLAGQVHAGLDADHVAGV